MARSRFEEVYNNDLEKVDLMTGLYAEPLPEGFGFSETAFRIFILMASRRLKSDRFFTDDYRPEVYTEFGLDYIKKNSMLTVLQRHYPAARRRRLPGVENAFQPWKTITPPAAWYGAMRLCICHRPTPKAQLPRSKSDDRRFAVGSWDGIGPDPRRTYGTVSRAPANPSDIVEHFKYGAIGTEERAGVPYWIWRVLPDRLR